MLPVVFARLIPAIQLPYIGICQQSVLGDFKSQCAILKGDEVHQVAPQNSSRSFSTGRRGALVKEAT